MQSAQLNVLRRNDDVAFCSSATLSPPCAQAKGRVCSIMSELRPLDIGTPRQENINIEHSALITIDVFVMTDDRCMILKT